MRKMLKGLPVLIVILALALPSNASALVDCIDRADDAFNHCMTQAVVKGVWGMVIGGALGLLSAGIGAGIGASAGFINGTGGAAYACEDNYISATDDCYATYPLRTT